MHTTTLLAKESNTVSTAYHSALPLGSHPLSGGFDLTVEEEMYNLKQEMKVLKANYVTVRKDLNSLSTELEELRDLVVGTVIEAWGNRVADKPSLTALKEYVNKPRNYERYDVALPNEIDLGN